MVVRRTSLVVTAVLGAVLLGSGTAGADEWPVNPPYPSPTAPQEITGGFLTPQDPAYWNPLVSENRLTSPYGNNTRLVCTGFHGVLLECWQADVDGNPHKLIKLDLDYPGSTGAGLPGGGPGHFVYPGFIPGLG
ncbi:MAG: hypothetical protein WBQ44_18735 [Rhodococcus sp. (in: high G+C Gram-positive bacteria)]